MIQIKHNKLRISTGGRLTSWLFARCWRSWIRGHWRQIHLVAGRRIWTRDLRISSPVPYQRLTTVLYWWRIHAMLNMLRISFVEAFPYFFTRYYVSATCLLITACKNIELLNHSLTWVVLFSPAHVTLWKHNCQMHFSLILWFQLMKTALHNGGSWPGVRTVPC